MENTSWVGFDPMPFESCACGPLLYQLAPRRGGGRQQQISCGDNNNNNIVFLHYMTVYQQLSHTRFGGWGVVGGL